MYWLFTFVAVKSFILIGRPVEFPDNAKAAVDKTVGLRLETANPS
jgi:hypothetical protein